MAKENMMDVVDNANELRITKEMLKKAIPRRLHKNITPGVIKKLNMIQNNPHTAVNFRENLLGYGQILKNGKFGLTHYINAVRYVSYKMLGASNILAYAQTFPKRYNRLVKKGTSEKDIAAYVSAYNRNKLVNLILEQTMVPTWVLNAELHQKAINAQADLMMHARSEKVRCDAANSLLTHLKPPEAAKVELEIGVKEDDSIKQLREATLELVRKQRAMIAAGQASVKSIAEADLVKLEEAEDAEYEELPDVEC